MLSLVVLVFFFVKEAIPHPLSKEVFDISSEVAGGILDWQASCENLAELPRNRCFPLVSKFFVPVSPSKHPRAFL
jgi:hypothetical protein